MPKAELRLAPVRYQLALAHLQAGNPQQAKTELKEAVTIAPNFAALEAELATGRELCTAQRAHGVGPGVKGPGG